MDEILARMEEEPCKGTRTRRILHEAHVTITSDKDILTARQIGRQIAVRFGFRGSDPTLIAAAISELGRDLLCWATPGGIVLRLIADKLRLGIEVVAADEGAGTLDWTPGAPGLAAARRLMDECEMIARLGAGTIVIGRKWRR